MFGKKVIAVLVLAGYLFASVANAIGVLACDCASHHRHDFCCASVDDDHGHGHCSHSHDLCSAFCDTDGCGQTLAQHCECTHSHGEAFVFTTENDGESLLKHTKIYAAEISCALCEAQAEDSAGTHILLRAVGDRPLAPPPVVPSRAPRAPSAMA